MNHAARLLLLALVLAAAPARADFPDVSLSGSSCEASSPNAGGNACGNGALCLTTSAGADTGTALKNILFKAFSEASQNLENFLGAPSAPAEDIVEGMPATTGIILLFTGTEYNIGDWLERRLVKRWQDMWDYQLLPGLQALARQSSTDLAMQALGLGRMSDARQTQESANDIRRREADDGAMASGGAGGDCVACTQAGSLSRANGISRLLRGAWERDSIAGNAHNSPKVYLSQFCKPTSNGGANICTLRNDSSGAPVDPHTYAYYNADVEPTRFLYNKMTIDAIAHPEELASVQALIDNIAGTAGTDMMSADAASTPSGRGIFVGRRSLMSRVDAIRSVPALVASWRMPGSPKPGEGQADDGMQASVAALRTAAGLSGASLSKNPSYKEILHALSVDRFNSGAYAQGMITDPRALEMEKLTLSALYLMQLRDYYELLERTALTLAVQVSVTNDANRGRAPVANNPVNER